MLVKATTLKIVNAALAVGNLSLFSYLFDDMQHVVTFIYFNAAIILAASIFDFGLNAVNSSVTLQSGTFCVPSFMENFFNFSIDRVLIMTVIPILGLILTSDKVLIIGILLCVSLRIFIMRWITIERKDISVISSILRAELPLTIVNCVTIYALTKSPYFFIIGQFLGNIAVLYGLRNTTSFGLLWKFEKTRSFSITHIHDFSVVIQSYMSAFKNNITGILLGNISGANADTLFLANRLGQIYLVGYSGLLTSIPRLLRLNDQKLGNNWFIIALPPLLLISSIMFLPDLCSFIVNIIYNTEIGTYNQILVLIILSPVVFSFLNIYLISNNYQWSNITLDLIEIIAISVGVILWV